MSGAPNGGTWSRASKAAALDRRLSSEAFRVLAILGCYADAEGRCHPSVTTVAGHLRLKRRMVQYHIRRLEALGYIVTTRRIRTRGGWTSNAYQLCFPAPPSLAGGIPYNSAKSFSPTGDANDVQSHCAS
jgi:hypothetical protein